MINDDIARGFDLSYAAYDPIFFVLPGLFTNFSRLEQSDFSQELRLRSR